MVHCLDVVGVLLADHAPADLEGRGEFPGLDCPWGVEERIAPDLFVIRDLGVDPLDGTVQLA